MSLKVKLISTISAFILTLSCLLVGVFAAQNVSLTVGGNVSFTASSVYADITGSYVGTTEHTSTAQSLTPISIDAETTDGAVSMPSDWTSMPLNFNSVASPITVTIKIQNKATDRSIAVSLTDSTSITGVSVARKYNNATFSGNTTSQTIAGGNTGTFTFELTVTNQNANISGKFSLAISLANNNNVVSTGKYTATVVNNSGDTYYLKTDTSEVQTLSNGETIKILGNNAISFALVSSWLNELSGSNFGEVEPLVEWHPEGSQAGESTYCDVVINGQKVVSGGNSWSGAQSGGSVSTDGNVYTYTLTSNCTIELN